MEYATLESRLATYEPPTKRSKLGWPHKTPTPEDLAKAGFYYKPSKSSNDNTICYLCDRQLGGWEPDDDPIEEHMKHSPECGWAILMTAARDVKQDADAMEDPTGQLLEDARRATFAIGWPHESKRGWRCKTEKMVEAGWYFTPVAEGEDYVSCVYCKLSVDGWEPKDDPFEEHHRRSPNCIFFHFAGSTAPAKRPKAKKGRASRTSRTSKASTRLSSQSTTQDMTMLSEAASTAPNQIPDLEDSIDGSETSNMSMMSTASTATTKGKRKGAGGRAKATKSKKAKTTKSTRGKKKDSEAQIEAESVEAVVEVPVHAAEPELAPPEPEIAEVDLEDDEQEQRALIDALPSPPAEIAYPRMPVNHTPPRLPSEPRHLSPVGVALDNSPTPIKPRSTRSSLASAVKPTPKSATSRSQAQSTHPPPTSSAQGQNPTSNSSPTPSPSTSDIENAPPSTRQPTSRRSISSPHAAPVATKSPSTHLTVPVWTPADIETIFTATSPTKSTSTETFLALAASSLSSQEQQMTVQEWIEHVAGRAEDGLRHEAERVVGIFEREGQRAMGVLEGLACI